MSALGPILERYLGLSEEAQREEEMTRVLTERLRATGCATVDAYCRRLERPETRAVELAAVAAALTMSETFFFREPAAFAFIVEAVRAGATRILCAGCSTGEEAYGLAITLREALGPDAGGARVLAVDVNHAALERARNARYSAWSLRATPPAARARFFRAEGENRFALAPEICGAVDFADANLLDADDGLLAPGSFDVILCRNVFIYLSTRAVAAILARFAAALPPGGLLVLGSADATVPFLTGAAGVPGAALVDEPFDAERRDDVLFYRRRGPLSPTPAAPRVRAAEPPPAPSLEAMAAELRAGHYQGAASAAELLLARSPRSPEARFVLALCREQAGEPAAAMALHEEAVARDPGFALAHLRLGLLSLQAGSIAEARRALEAALRTMPGEDERRLALFGGGFRAEALSEIAAAALRRARGGPS